MPRGRRTIGRGARGRRLPWGASWRASIKTSRARASSAIDRCPTHGQQSSGEALSPVHQMNGHGQSCHENYLYLLTFVSPCAMRACMNTLMDMVHDTTASAEPSRTPSTSPPLPPPPPCLGRSRPCCCCLVLAPLPGIASCVHNTSNPSLIRSRV